MAESIQNWRCPAHQLFGAGTCTRCGNPLCSRCVAENTALICAACGKGPAVAPVSDHVPLQIAKIAQLIGLAALAVFLVWQAIDAPTLMDGIWKLWMAIAMCVLFRRVWNKPDDDSMIQR